jgi:hypothetical protein
LKILYREPRAEAIDKDGFSIFLKKILCRGSGAEAVGKDGFSIFFENIMCRGSVAKAVGKDGFLFFKKISLPSAFGNYSRQRWEHSSWENFSQSCRA